MTIDYKNKSVIITGAGTGIGRALSLELASRGAIVYATALTQDEAQGVVDAITAAGGTAHAAKLDVCDNTDLRAVIDRVITEQGQLDLIINNAGVAFVGEFYDMDEGAVESLIAVNLTAVTMGCLYAYRQMKAQGFGQILNISSMGGFMPAPAMAVYTATKHGVLGLTNTLAVEAKDFGIDVQAACLGNVQSELLNKSDGVAGSAKTFGAIIPKAAPTDKVAAQIIDRLSRRKHPVFAPSYAGFVWRLMRAFPRLLIKGSGDTMRKYRKAMAEDGGA
ncbi:MAG: SDR family NAD(P)-dependent oxidoreductase [Maricaulaceae bacterium]